jgi:small subunit ribosomal protein S20
MANHESAVKEHRRSLARRETNRRHRSRLRTAVKRLRQAVDAGDRETAVKLLPETLSIVDHSAKLGALHGNAADRTKSRLTRAVNRLSA